MPKSSAAAHGDATTFIGATATFYVPSERTDEFVKMAKDAEVIVRHDPVRKVYVAQIATMDFSNDATQELSDTFGPFTAAHRAHKEEMARPKAVDHAAERGAESRRGDVVAASIGVGVKALVPQDAPGVAAPPRVDLDRVQDIARAKAAEQSNDEFRARYIRYGFQLKNGLRDPARNKEQMAQLDGASTEALREVAARTSERYRELCDKEDRIRFDHAISHDRGTAARLGKIIEGGRDRKLAYEEALEAFSKQDNGVKKRLASIGRQTPAGLPDMERAALTSLSWGFKAIAEKIYERTGKSLGYDVQRVQSKMGVSLPSSLGGVALDDKGKALEAPKAARPAAAKQAADEIER